MSDQKAKNILHMMYDDKGYPRWRTEMSPEENTTRAFCIVPPDQVMPVIFVPGIMGSNLKLKRPLDWFNRGKDISWRPSDSGYTAVTFGGLTPAQRRLVLDPENTELDERGEIPDSALLSSAAAAPMFSSELADITKNWKAEFTRRGWGTVMLSSYADILYSLELNLNRIYLSQRHGPANNVSHYWQTLVRNQATTIYKDGGVKHPWGEMRGYEALNIDELKEKVGDRYWLPVHAAGYNWLRSNEDAGKDLAERVKKIIKHYVDLDFFCEKVIVVTHSMGGLAARAMCHPKMGNIAHLVAGVVHGEQPALGAAAAYKRMHAGFESGWNPKTAITARALGKTGKEVTACLANARGGLELLPTKRYPSGWLGVKADGHDMMARLPISNPYAEIYAERDKWWRLVNPEWIEPSEPSVTTSTSKQLNKIWERYTARLKLVETFHDKLGDYYHDVTHAHYGADREHKAWTNFNWELKKENPRARGYQGPLEVTTEAPNADLVADNADGTIKIRSKSVPTGLFINPSVTSKYVMSQTDLPGDGTVPECSGADSAMKAKFSAKMTGYDHQGSYENTAVKDVTTYSVVRIAKDA